MILKNLTLRRRSRAWIWTIAPATLLLYGVAWVGCGGTLSGGSSAASPPAASASAESSREDSEEHGGPARLPEDVRPLGYELALTLLPEQPRFKGDMRIAVELRRATDGIWLHGLDLDVLEAQIIPAGASPIDARWEAIGETGLAKLVTDRKVPAGAAELHLVYEADFHDGLDGLYRVARGEDAYVFTQFEPIAARRAFPCFDEPRFKVPFDVSLTVRQEHSAIANTRTLSTEMLDGGLKRVRFATTERLPSYLIAFAVGPFDVVEGPSVPANAVRETPLALRGIAERGKGDQLAYALQHTGPLLEALEEYFGSPYPYDKLDIIAVPDFSSGAMENAGAITFRDWLLLIDEQHASERQRRAFAEVMAHELAHQWFGNLVTMAWWDDLWLNEAFATWMSYRAVDAVFPEHNGGQDLLGGVQHAMGEDSLSSARAVRQPIETDHDIRNAFDAITYLKGAGVIAMFERYMGPDAFQQGIRDYLAKHRFGTATADDFLRAMSKVAGEELAPAFRSFLDQPGVPLVEAELVCEAGKGKLVLHQRRYLPVGSRAPTDMRWQVPVCARYPVPGGTAHACTLLTEWEGELPLPDTGKSCPAWAMPNFEGAGYYRFTLPGAQLETLLSKVRRDLSSQERMAVSDSLIAGFKAATLSVSDVFPTFPALVRDKERPVVTAPMELLRFARDHLVHDAQRERVERFAQSLYRPLYESLGWEGRPNEDGERRLLRAQVIGFLTEMGDPRVRDQAARRGQRYVGYGQDGGLQPGAVPTDLVLPSVKTAVQAGDAEFFEAVLTQLQASDNPMVRGQLLRALGSAWQQPLAQRALALTVDERLRKNETPIILSTQMRDPRTRSGAWAWLQANFDAVVSRYPHRGDLPWQAGGFCTEADARDVEEFFGPRVERLAGGPRNLAQVTEAIRLCAERVAVHQGAAQDLFRGLGGLRSSR